MEALAKGLSKLYFFFNQKYLLLQKLSQKNLNLKNMLLFQKVPYFVTVLLIV